MPKPRAFFFLPERALRPDGIRGYPHAAVTLAEGLSGQGWEIASTVRDWVAEPGGPALFPGNAALEGADLIVFGEEYFICQDSDRLPDAVSRVDIPMVFLDRSHLLRYTAWNSGRSMRKFDRIYRCHGSSYFKYPDNVRQSVFGISNRIALACAGGSEERDGIMWNFRHTQHAHNTRIWAERHVKPVVREHLETKVTRNGDAEPPTTEYERLMRWQTDGKHFASYYDEMKRSLVCSCFGGWFLFPIKQQEGGPFCLKTRGLIRRLPIATKAIGQWDSWRLWEAFAAGTAVMHFNFDEYGFLPGGPPPIQMKHYIPVTERTVKELPDILADRRLLREIGRAGQEWAMENYSSTAISSRILEDLGLARANMDGTSYVDERSFGIRPEPHV
jgi:hypothetical protein